MSDFVKQFMIYLAQWVFGMFICYLLLLAGFWLWEGIKWIVK